MSEIHELAVIEIEAKKRAAEELKPPAFEWSMLVKYAKKLCPELVSPEMLEQAESARLRYEFALMEVEEAKRFVNSALRKVLREKETYGLRIKDLTQSDVGRKVVVLFGPKTEETAELWAGIKHA